MSSIFDEKFPDESILEESKRNSKENNFIINTIKVATLGGISRIINMFRYGVNFQNLSFDRKRQVYVYNDGKRIIEFKKISSVIDDLLLRIILNTPIRCNECQSSSAELAGIVKFSKSFLTGYYYVDNGKFLHTVIETEENGELFIYDFTSNIIMKKELFVELFKFELIKEISVGDYNVQKNILPNKRSYIKILSNTWSSR